MLFILLWLAVKQCPEMCLRLSLHNLCMLSSSLASVDSMALKVLSEETAVYLGSFEVQNHKYSYRREAGGDLI